MKATETKSVVLLHHHLKCLRLPTVAAECEKVATQAAADNADHLSYLLRLTELELLEREKRAAERRVKAARFPTIKTLETFDFAARPSVNKVLVAELMRCEYIDKKENILMVGNPGHREEPPGHRAGRPGVRQGLPGPLHPHHRAGHRPHRGPRRADASCASRASSPSSTCSSSTNWATCRPPRSAPSCSSTSSPPPMSAPA